MNDNIKESINFKNEINLQEIKERLENSRNFQYYHNAIGLTFDDFNVIDLKENEIIAARKRNIGLFDILILADGTFNASFDIDADKFKYKKH